MTQHRLVCLSLATDNSYIDAWSAEAYYSLTLLTYLRHLSPKMLVLRYCQNCWRRFTDDQVLLCRHELRTSGRANDALSPPHMHWN